MTVHCSEFQLKLTIAEPTKPQWPATYILLFLSNITIIHNIGKNGNKTEKLKNDGSLFRIQIKIDESLWHHEIF